MNTAFCSPFPFVSQHPNAKLITNSKCSTKRIQFGFPIPKSTSSFSKRSIIQCRTQQKQTSQTTETVLKSIAAAVAAFVITATTITLPAQAGINSSPLRFSQSLLDETEQNGVTKLNAHWDLHSVDSQTETLLMFSNDSNEVVDLWWIDYYGKEVYYASINPGTTHMQPSYVTHPWVVRDHISSNPVLVVVASPQPALAIVNDS